MSWARASVSGLRTDNGENRGNPNGCKFYENDADAMRMFTWDEMHNKNKMQSNRQKPNHEENIILHLRKRQELELRIWKVVSRALQLVTGSASALTSYLSYGAHEMVVHVKNIFPYLNKDRLRPFEYKLDTIWNMQPHLTPWSYSKHLGWWFIESEVINSRATFTVSICWHCTLYSAVTCLAYPHTKLERFLSFLFCFSHGSRV